MTKKHLKKKYDILIKDVKTKDFYKIKLTNRVNCYTCYCGHITKTKDVDAGVTPFLHSCEKCNKLASSSFYNDIAPRLFPTEEWYRPDFKELLTVSEEELDHVLNGGLLNRKI